MILESDGGGLSEECRKALERLIKHCLIDLDLGIPNKLYWNVLGKRELQVAKRLGSPVSVLFVDVDGLKKINDTFGHLAGDIYLKKIANILKSHVRGSDLVIRWGGDEFLILLHTDEKGAKIVKQRIQESMEKARIEIGSRIVKPSVSIGVAEVNGSFLDAVALADRRMYEEKKGKRSQETSSILSFE